MCCPLSFIPQTLTKYLFTHNECTVLGTDGVKDIQDRVFIIKKLAIYLGKGNRYVCVECMCGAGGEEGEGEREREGGRERGREREREKDRERERDRGRERERKILYLLYLLYEAYAKSVVHRRKIIGRQGSK